VRLYIFGLYIILDFLHIVRAYLNQSTITIKDHNKVALPTETTSYHTSI